MKSILMTIAFCASTILVSAQTPEITIPKPWTPGAVGFGLKMNWDIYNNMSIDQMYDHAANASDIQLDLTGYEEQASKSVFGLGIGGSFSLLRNGSPNKELILTAGVITGREGVIDYTKAGPMSGDTMFNESITYCNMDNEWNVGASYLIKKGNRFKVFTGLSGNIGGSFGKQMVLLFNKSRYIEDYSYYESEEWRDNEFHDANGSIYVRAKIPFGMSYTFFRRLELNSSINLGVGAQKVMNGNTYFMAHTGSFNFGVRYHVKPLQTNGKGKTVSELLGIN